MAENKILTPYEERTIREKGREDALNGYGYDNGISFWDEFSTFSDKGNQKLQEIRDIYRKGHEEGEFTKKYVK